MVGSLVKWMWIAALVVSAVSVPAQQSRAPEGATMSGRITILEQPGKVATDVGSTVIFLEPAGGGKGTVAATDLQIAMQSKQFVPRVRVVTAGSRVNFPNQDPFRHNVFSNTPGGTFDLGLYPRGNARAASFRRVGVYPIFCNIHSRMSAFVVAVPTSHYTQAQSDGSWTIDGVPSGRYILHVWHERAPERTREIVVGEVALHGLDEQLDARGWRPMSHKNKFGHDYPPTERDRY
jgi:plastocyanin